MAFQSISDYGAKPVFQTLIASGATTDPVFAFKLAKSGAELTLGGLNSQLYTGNLTYVPVTQEGYWQVDMDSANVNGKSVLGSISVIIDSGTSLIVGLPDDVETFYSSVDGAEPSEIGDGYYSESIISRFSPHCLLI
jgi:cathepsin D